ncbi:MAG: DUF433 domain-containing protein [Chloroflexi bacterium]|nr:DUF433 domain-containing protein [Chloroflexota bacterium]MYE42354.1 DUF433 domain-containing protein [Chloroflexota bacterium]
MADHVPIDYTGIITVEPGKRYGKHFVRDLPVTVGDVLGQLAAGISEEEILNHFPDLTGKDIKACLSFAAARERRSVTAPPDMPAVNDYSHIITIEPGKRFGRPCIRGMRITVYDVLEWLAGGMAYEEILDEFPELTIEDILASIAFVADPKRRFQLVPQGAVAWTKEAFDVVSEP